MKATVEPDGSRYVEVHNPLSTTEEQFNSRELVPITLTQAVSKIVVDASVNQDQVNAAIQSRTGMPVKVNGVENNVQTAPVPVPENSQAAPQEEPMTPVTPQGASSDATQPQQPQQPATEPAAPAAPVTPAAPAAAANTSS